MTSTVEGEDGDEGEPGEEGEPPMLVEEFDPPQLNQKAKPATKMTIATAAESFHWPLRDMRTPTLAL